MLTIELRFLAGRYHATPWGRSVNEADVEWPPSPWRILRALLAIWHRKIPELPQAEVHALINELASSPPNYALPPAVHSHTRHYMPLREIDKTSLVYDAYLAIDPKTPLYIHWPALDLTEQSRKTLETLLVHMSYLGRAESWVEAELTDTRPATNSQPEGDTVDPITGEITGDTTRLLSPPNANSYRAWVDENRDAMLSSFKGTKRKQLAYILPDTLPEALDRDTADWQAVDKGVPAFSCWIRYNRPRLASPPLVKRLTSAKRIDIARFALNGKPRMRLRNTLKQAEWFRRALIKNSDKNPFLTGHDLPNDNRHQHAFILPEDLDNDGQLDHLLVFVPGGINTAGQAALNNIQRLWDYKGRNIDLTLLDMGQTGEWAAARPTDNGLAGHSTIWHSTTPWYCPWYMKKNRSLVDETNRYVAREFQARGITSIPKVRISECQQLREGSKYLEIIRFHHQRNKKQAPPSNRGLMLELEFADSYTGPLALGYGCHFGLGAFSPVKT